MVGWKGNRTVNWEGVQLTGTGEKTYPAGN